MAEFMVRVEIFKANSEDYTGLHDGMEALGLMRTVQGDKALSKMPPGTYFGASSLSAYALREKIRVIALPFSSPVEPSVFVAEVSDWSSWLRTA